LYDSIGVFSSPRGAFTFIGGSQLPYLEFYPRHAIADTAAFGHEKVSILDGGLPRWIADGGEVEVGETKESEGVAASDYKGAEDRSAEFIRCELSHSLGGDMGEKLTWTAYEQVVENSEKGPEGEVVLDHRPLPR
jgi:thiosulfate/3-mercaptopyruvate sulfurtransferase